MRRTLRRRRPSRTAVSAPSGARLDAAQMPGRRDPRTQPSEYRPRAEQNRDVLVGGAAQHVAAAVGPCERRDRLTEHGDRSGDDAPGEQRATEPVQHAGVQKRATHEGVGPAYQLGDLDLGAAPLDLQADGVADDREYAD